MKLNHLMMELETELLTLEPGLFRNKKDDYDDDYGDEDIDDEDFDDDDYLEEDLPDEDEDDKGYSDDWE